MSLATLYLVLCFLGTVLPYTAFIPFLLEHGPNPRVFASQLFASRIGAFFGLDVLVATITLWVLVIAEGRRSGVRHLWAPFLASLTVGISLGLPLFLYLRERRLAAGARAGTSAPDF